MFAKNDRNAVKDVRSAGAGPGAPGSVRATAL
jgi:hypothetical protein